MNALIEQFFNLEVMAQAFPFLLKGLGVTILLTLLLTPLGLALGLALALGSSARHRGLRRAVRIWVNGFRGLPPLVLIIIVYSALPFLGLRTPPLMAVVIALWLNSSAYYCEILRAGLGSVPAGQMEAARATGLGRAQALRDVVLPQAVRNVLPDLASNTIELVKGTSLASIIGVSELLHMASNARSVVYNASPITLAALMYLAFLLPSVRLTGWLERRRRGA
ncbi:amino acid ABC transporter permease [Mangrovicoccus algicola]|uniref:Amino acid ABC transporter permease n=1 Tax=Mangrovicoccus algicola TaxID=2771008 RepID=A0A8J6Z9H2_9RHOB|nr:amino acid ABC transporter permease [Mangrovicoccus algicola]MBE3638780.1 amino acid ABC transporter permease [Mangrovicoccus algicola]